MTWLQEAHAHAAAEAPRESCGVVIIQHGRERYWPCRNLAEEDFFRLDPSDYAEAEAHGQVVRIVHSHVNYSANPSDADRAACEKTGLPWTIIGVPSGEVRELEPSGFKAPIVGRKYAFGVHDCWTIIRDWFREARGIELPDYDSGPYGWWNEGGDLYRQNFAAAGFRQIEERELQAGDCMLFQIRAKVPNHAAVYLGNQMILHHQEGRLSCRELYGGYIRKMATHWLRYER